MSTSKKGKTTRKAVTMTTANGKAAKARPTGEKRAKRVSALDAAAQVLKKASRPMRAGEIITAMGAQGLWKSPGGKTPHATLYAAILREVAHKGKAARFKKTDRGLFAFNKTAGL